MKKLDGERAVEREQGESIRIYRSCEIVAKCCPPDSGAFADGEKTSKKSSFVFLFECPQGCRHAQVATNTGGAIDI